jgi:cytochrome b561
MIQFVLPQPGGYQGSPRAERTRLPRAGHIAVNRKRQRHDSKYGFRLGQHSRWFHWILGASVIGMIAYGSWMNHVPPRADRFFYRSIHADIGYVVLMLTVLRLVWRGVNPTPALPDDAPRWQRIAARVSHGALYLVTILVSMLGWAMSGASTRNYSDWFGLFRVPQITSPDRAAAHAYEDRHIFFAYVLLALIVLHVAAAAWHHFVRRDRVAMRMVDGRPSS